MAAVEYAPEMPDRIRETLARYEGLFKDRYTNNDQGYRSACQMEQT